MNRPKLLLLAVICFTNTVFAYEIVVLSSEKSPFLTQQCSRIAPKNITGTWKIDSEQIKLLRQALPPFLKQESSRCCGGPAIGAIDTYAYQVGGLLIDGKKRLYVNAVDKSVWSVLPNKQEAFVACDGGAMFWGVLFDPETKTFTDLAINRNI